MDHIVPRSRGGTNDLSNLQALSSLCNVQKLDRDQTDFHAAHLAMKERQVGCDVCAGFKDLHERLAGPVTIDGHLAVAPVRHGVS